ncbi:hypothetical protein ACFVS2_22250 [Brevibacillus sp. NPDC058079]|uniref:hypothetical protein n=1 Tax=Brevibacillus sp. NPDC058079 TaxID=3346330 RepID=UPI0036E91F20
MKKEIVLNGTSVTVEDTNDKMTSVHIETDDADIYVNGVLVWQKYDQPEYAKIPPIFRAFVEERTDEVYEHDGKIGADLHKKGFHTSVSFYFPQNSRSYIQARLDGVTDLSELEIDFIRNNTLIDDAKANTLVEEFNALWKDIEETVKEAGWRLAYAHDMGDKCWAWWDVIFKQEDWNQDTFIDIWQKFSVFNKRLNEVFDKYEM